MGNFSLIENLANYLSVPEPAFRLLISIFSTYPLAAFYSFFICKKHSPTLSHIYFTITGLTLCIFNYGFDVFHGLISILLTYILIILLYKKPKYLVKINFIFHMSYLLIGYYYTESDDYDIKWTMPHCVLVLRLIGFVFDISDGQKPYENLSNEQKESSIRKLPTLLELTGYTYFPASCLVGPQFPFQRYKNFTTFQYEKYKKNWVCGLKRGLIGLLYLTIRHFGSTILPDNYFFTQEFKNINFLKKLAILGIWSKISFYKYISIWLIAEGAAICSGLTFVKIMENGEEDWSGCTNVKLIIFETANKLGKYVLSFNVNTNNWLAQYVYKRLKFLGNQSISYAGALLFLALWHGLHTGYYMAFSMEYIVLTFEKQFQSAFDSIKWKEKFINNIIIRIIIFIVCKMYTLILMGWCLIPFVFLNYEKWMYIYSLYNYWGYIFFVVWFVGYFTYKKLYIKRNKVKEN